MKTKRYIIILFLLTNIQFYINAQEQIPEGNFENWVNNNEEIPPWKNYIDIGFIIYTAEQSSDALQGSYAASLISKENFGQFVPGLITLGDLDVVNQTLTGGIPYSDNPDGIGFFFKYLPSGVDTMFFAAFLTKWNSVYSQTDTIAITGYFNSNVYDTYTKVNLPFMYSSAEIPDTLNIIFTSSGMSGNAGSRLYLDSISMINGTIVSPTICFPADEITSLSFKAHWLTIPGATSYSLDVSENENFSYFITGYENLNTGLDTFYTVNITPGTYYYKVRVNYDTETSINSNTIETIIENSDIKHFKIPKTIIFSNQGNIYVSSENIIDEINIYGIDGKLILSKNPFSDNFKVSVNSYGIFIVEIRSRDKILRKKISLFY